MFTGKLPTARKQRRRNETRMTHALELREEDVIIPPFFRHHSRIIISPLSCAHSEVLNSPEGRAEIASLKRKEILIKARTVNSNIG